MKCEGKNLLGVSYESLPVRGAWIEIGARPVSGSRKQSLPVRGAWIEIVAAAEVGYLEKVAPRAGSVD